MMIRTFWLSLFLLMVWPPVVTGTPGEKIKADSSAKGETPTSDPTQDQAKVPEGNKDKVPEVDRSQEVVGAVPTTPLAKISEEEFPTPKTPKPLSLTTAQKVSFAQIEVLESARRKERSVWRPLLANQDYIVVAKALRGIGRVQAIELLGLIESKLASESPIVRLEAAFAYGQTPEAGTGPLLLRLGVERNPRVKQRLVEAVSKIGGIADVSTLVPMTQGGDVKLRSAVFIALAVIAHRTKAELLGLDAIWAAAPSSNEALALRYGWAYLALRARKNLQTTLLGSLSTCIKDPAPSVRALCARAQGRFKEASVLGRRSALEDQNWRVQVASIRSDLEAKDAALLNLRLSRFLTALTENRFDASGVELNVALTTIDALRSLPAKPETVPVEKALHKATVPETNVPFSLGLAHLNCGAATLIDRRRGRPRLTLSCGTANYPKSRRHRWMVDVTSGLKGAARLKALMRMYPKFETSGRLAIIEALAKLPPSPKTSTLLVKALQGTDPALAGTAADIGARLKLNKLVPILTDAYQRFYGRGDFETVQSIFGAFGALAAEASHEILNRHSNDSHPGVRYAARKALKAVDKAIRLKMTSAGRSAAFLPGRRSFLPPPAESFGGEQPDTQIVKRSSIAQAILKTTKGDIRIQLYRADARETVKNFTRLAQRKYYDGLLFHRVVPAFIVQTGDPKATGWGGPGYTIPCEVNPFRFERGTVGMALAGRDTGGGQFFITHDRSPHLDGSYTVFGQVVEGQSVVDSITEGDQIHSVELRSVK